MQTRFLERKAIFVQIFPVLQLHVPFQHPSTIRAKLFCKVYGGKHSEITTTESLIAISVPTY